MKLFAVCLISIMAAGCATFHVRTETPQAGGLPPVVCDGTVASFFKSSDEVGGALCGATLNAKGTAGDAAMAEGITAGVIRGLAAAK